MAPWNPGDPWPSATPGGASSPAWSPYVRLWLRAGLAPGNTFHVGAHNYDRLDSGNVLSGGGALEDAPRASDPTRLWVDLSCDTIDLEIAGGSSSAQGIFSKPDAATLVATLADPDGIYDPLSPDSPWSYGGHSRLVPGTPVEAFAEVVNGDTGAYERVWLFTGTADSWGEDWTPKRSSRRAKLIASDATKQWTRYDQPEQASQGANENTKQRVERLVAFYGWSGTIEPASSSTVTLQATTLAAAGWELLNRTLDDELGFVYFTPAGALRWINRDAWTARPAPVLELGCEAKDVLVDASPSSIDYQIRNKIYAARVGGTTQVAISQSSIDKFRLAYDYKRTDLGLASDAQAATWATFVLQLYAYPQTSLADITLRPAIDPRAWETYSPALKIKYVTDLVRIVWAPPDLPEHEIDVTARVVGSSHRITRAHWEIKWQLVTAGGASGSSSAFTLGPHAQDRLDNNFVLV